MLKESEYVEEFDSLRAVAALGVMAAHFAPLSAVPILGRLEPRLGALGVDLFFALSGFLITGILLRCRHLLETQSIEFTLQQFYIRRFLRIFPLYYLVFFAFAAFLAPELRQNWIWFLTYTVNYGKAFADHWVPLNHFWTLAVEEQFYIVWPCIVLLVPRSRLLAVCVVCAAISTGSRLYLSAITASPVAITQFTHCCLEPLVLGSAFALRPPARRTPAIWLLLVGSGLATGLIFVFAEQTTLFVFSRTAYGVFFAALVYVIAGKSGTAKLAALRIRPVTFLGKISYGLYVWHLPVMWIFPRGWAGSLPVVWRATQLVEFLAFVVVTVAVSVVSWYVFERPINALKRRFPYRVTTAPAAAVGVSD